MTSETFTQALKVGDLPANSKKVVEIDGKPVLLCNVNGKVHAVSNICSHADEKLDSGRMGNGWIACPVHGARFDLKSGAAKNPPATQPIPVYETQVTGDWIEMKL